MLGGPPPIPVIVSISRGDNEGNIRVLSYSYDCYYRMRGPPKV